MNNSTLNRIIPAGIIGLAILICAGLGLLAVFHITSSMNKDTVAVKGYAEKIVESDTGWLSCTISCRGSSLQAVHRQIQQHQNKVIVFIKSYNIEDTEIDSAPLSITTMYTTDSNGNRTNTVEGYSGSLSVSISTPKLDTITLLSKELAKLLESGINIRTSQPQFFISDIEQYKLELLKNASESAQIRAEEIAAASNAKRGRLRSSGQGVFQITAPQSVDISGYGEYDTYSRTKKISIVVTNEYRIE
ncbi:MAG: SIMPL domain-containing protein [Spirochaetales bacterium]|nr:SIMPL domain-containing protein [Spirochaetales bacterium]